MNKTNLLSAVIVSAAAILLGVVSTPSYADTVATSGSASVSESSAATGPVIINTAAPTPSKTTTEVKGTQTIKNVASIAPPSLTTTLTDTCMGSTSGGVTVAGFGISGGGTWVDQECVNRLNARELRTLGEDGLAAAKEVMCENKVVRAAYQKVGKPCVGDAVSANSAKVSTNNVQNAAPAQMAESSIVLPVQPAEQTVALNDSKYKDGDTIEFSGTRWQKQGDSWLAIKD